MGFFIMAAASTSTGGGIGLQEVLGLILRVVGGLGVVAILAYGISRLSEFRVRKSRHGSIDLIDELHLDRGRSLYLIKTGSKIILFVCSGEGISLLTEFDESQISLPVNSVENESNIISHILNRIQNK